MNILLVCPSISLSEDETFSSLGFWKSNILFRLGVWKIKVRSTHEFLEKSGKPWLGKCWAPCIDVFKLCFHYFHYVHRTHPSLLQNILLFILFSRRFWKSEDQLSNALIFSIVLLSVCLQYIKCVVRSFAICNSKFPFPGFDLHWVRSIAIMFFTRGRTTFWIVNVYIECRVHSFCYFHSMLQRNLFRCEGSIWIVPFIISKYFLLSQFCVFSTD